MLPSLSSSRRIRLFAFTAYYAAQGFPIGLLTVAMPAWLAASGVAAADVANFVAITTLPWGFKLLAGPMMDRFKFPAMGGRRPWVIVAQTGLLLALVAMALSNAGASDVVLLTWAGFAVNSFAAIQDVAVDGMAIEVLPEDERGRANALMGFGQVAGYAGSGALCGWGLVAWGLAPTVLLVAMGVGLILALVIALRERAGEKLLPWSSGSIQHVEHTHLLGMGDIARKLLRALLLPTSVLMIIVILCWRFADGIFITAIPVLLTQELGWSSTEYSNWYANSSFVAAALGVFLGPWIDRHGARTYLALGLLGTALAYLVLAWGTPLWSSKPFWIAGLFAVNLMVQVVFVSAIALHMNLCWSKIAATQFAVYMAWANLSRSIGAKGYGEVAPFLEPGQECLLMAAVSVLGAVLVCLANLSNHAKRLQRLQDPQPAEDLAADVPAKF